MNTNTATAARPALRPFDADGLYFETITNIRAIIESEYGSAAKFCKEVGIDRFNVSKIFTAAERWARGESDSTKEMSVGTYLKICIALRLIDGNCIPDYQLKFTMSLKEYLLIDNNAVMKSIIRLNMFQQ